MPCISPAAKSATEASSRANPPASGPSSIRGVSHARPPTRSVYRPRFEAPVQWPTNWRHGIPFSSQRRPVCRPASRLRNQQVVRFIVGLSGAYRATMNDKTPCRFVPAKVASSRHRRAAAAKPPTAFATLERVVGERPCIPARTGCRSGPRPLGIGSIAELYPIAFLAAKPAFSPSISPREPPPPLPSAKERQPLICTNITN